MDTVRAVAEALKAVMERFPASDPDKAAGRTLRKWVTRWWILALRHQQAMDSRPRAQLRLAGMLVASELALRRLGVDMDVIIQEFEAEQQRVEAQRGHEEQGSGVGGGPGTGSAGGTGARGR